MSGGSATRDDATIVEIFASRVRQLGDAVAIRDERLETAFTWREYGTAALRAAAKLRATGLQRGETVGLMLTNRPEFHIADMATLLAGATPFSLYPFYRVASWYIAGGFTDEHGQWHESGHHHRFAYWEVLCEPDMRGMSPQTYTALFDAVVDRLRPLDPEMKFVGLSLTHKHQNPEYFWTFLDPADHRHGTAPDAMSLHFYAHPEIVDPLRPEPNAPESHWRDIYFAQADGFVEQVRLIDSIRRRIAPETLTFINEIGTFPADLMNPEPVISDEYWALSAAVQSYLWARLVELGMDLVGVAEFVGYPAMIPGVSLIDWETGKPNARYDALAYLLRHFGPGDAVVPTIAGRPDHLDPRVHAQGFITPDGTRKLLVINKTGAPIEVTPPDSGSVELAPYEVRVLLPPD